MAFQQMAESDIKDPAEESKKNNRMIEITSGNSLIMKTETAFNENIENFLPNYSKELSFCYPTTDIFDIFSRSARKKHFQITEKTANMATATFSQRYSFRNLLLCCLAPEQYQKKASSAVRIHININESTCKRIVNVKGIYGYPQIILSLITEFKSKLEDSLKSAKFQRKKYGSLTNDDEETVVTCKNESSSYYQFYKILSSEGYTLGKSISEFLQAFAEQYRNPEESVSMLPLPMNSIKETIEHSIEAIFTHYNYGRANSEKMMVHCRPAVEKFVFSKIYNVIFPIYVAKTERNEEEIRKIRFKILRYTDEELLAGLGIKAELGNSEYYKDSVEYLNRLEDFKSPFEKINMLENLLGGLRAFVLDFSKGSVELSEISDEVKGVSFILLRSKCKSIAAELELIKDYLGPKYLDKRDVRVFESAIDYIQTELVV